LSPQENLTPEERHRPANLSRIAGLGKQYADLYMAHLTQAGGPGCSAVASLAFRQAIAAHKLIKDADGVPFLMPKENSSVHLVKKPENRLTCMIAAVEEF